MAAVGRVTPLLMAPYGTITPPEDFGNGRGNGRFGRSGIAMRRVGEGVAPEGCALGKHRGIHREDSLRKTMRVSRTQIHTVAQTRTPAVLRPHASHECLGSRHACATRAQRAETLLLGLPLQAEDFGTKTWFSPSPTAPFPRTWTLGATSHSSAAK